MIELKNLRKSFEGELLLDIRGFTFQNGVSYLFFGPSGCGKTTLLNIIAGVIPADSGQVIVDGCDIGALSPVKRDAYRLSTVGYVFQEFYLLEKMTVEDNLRLLELELKRKVPVDRTLEALGLGPKKHKKITTLSSGEKQRVAIARALIKEPAVLLADEPTGNLDTATSNQVVDLLRERNAESATAFLIVTHDPALARRCDRVVELVDGVVVYDGAPSGMKSWD